MIDPDDLSIMTEEEKLDVLQRLSETDEWSESFLPIYTSLMDDDSPKVRQAAIVALWDLADTQHIEPLMDKAENDPDADVRGKAASVLGVYVYESLVNGALDEARYLVLRRFLLDIARDPDEALVVRRMAIEALSFDTGEDIQELIEWAYDHPAAEARMTAVFAMGRSGLDRWFDAILEELDSSEKRLRIEAINAAGEAAIAGATPRLRTLARDADKEVSLAAIWALAYVRGPGALETLEICSQSKDSEISEAAAEAIEEFYSIGRAEAEVDGEGGAPGPDL